VTAAKVDQASPGYDLMWEGADFPPWEGAPRRSVVVCSHPRSGSTLLGEAIYQAGGAGLPLEYFHRGFRPRFEARWGTPKLEDYVRVVHRHRTDPTGTFGVKLFWYDLMDVAHEHDGVPAADVPHWRPGEPQAEDYRRLYSKIEAAFPNPVFVHLRREDRVRQAVSGLIAEQTGEWRSIPGAGERASGEPSFDFDRLSALVAYAQACHAHWTALFAALGAEAYEISYEQLYGDYEASVGKLLRWIGAQTTDVSAPRLRRQSDDASEAMALKFLMESVRRRAHQATSG
jgi:LPS sulfotransferase NodH